MRFGARCRAATRSRRKRSFARRWRTSSPGTGRTWAGCAPCWRSTSGARALVDALLVNYAAGNPQPPAIEIPSWQAAFELCWSFGRAHGQFLRSMRDNPQFQGWREHLPAVALRLFQHRQIELLLRPFVDERSTRFPWKELHEAYRFAQACGVLHAPRAGQPMSLAGKDGNDTRARVHPSAAAGPDERRAIALRRRVPGKSEPSALVRGGGARVALRSEVPSTDSLSISTVTPGWRGGRAKRRARAWASTWPRSWRRCATKSRRFATPPAARRGFVVGTRTPAQAAGQGQRTLCAGATGDRASRGAQADGVDGRDCRRHGADPPQAARPAGRRGSGAATNDGNDRRRNDNGARRVHGTSAGRRPWRAEHDYAGVDRCGRHGPPAIDDGGPQRFGLPVAWAGARRRIRSCRAC